MTGEARSIKELLLGGPQQGEAEGNQAEILPSFRGEQKASVAQNRRSGREMVSRLVA